MFVLSGVAGRDSAGPVGWNLDRAAAGVNSAGCRCGAQKLRPSRAASPLHVVGNRRRGPAGLRIFTQAELHGSANRRTPQCGARRHRRSSSCRVEMAARASFLPLVRSARRSLADQPLSSGAKNRGTILWRTRNWFPVDLCACCVLAVSALCSTTWTSGRFSRR